MEPRALIHEVSGSGEPLVLLPGGLTGWGSWLPHAGRLAARWRAIRVQPVHNELGSAGHPGDPAYTAAVERACLRMTLDALAVATAHLAGWSAGATAALDFALAHPERVRTLVLIEPGADWVLERLGERDPAAERFEALMRGMAGRPVSEGDLADLLVALGLAGSAAEARADPDWGRLASHRAALSWHTEAAERFEWALGDLGRLDLPVLLVKGAASDAWLTRPVDALARLLPRASLLELPGGHACHIESIDAFLDAMQEHMRASARWRRTPVRVGGGPRGNLRGGKGATMDDERERSSRGDEGERPPHEAAEEERRPPRPVTEWPADAEDGDDEAAGAAQPPG